MTDNEIKGYEKAIEELNYEYRCLENSKEYRTGKKIRKMFSYIRTLNFHGFWKKMEYNKKVKQANKRFSDIKTCNPVHVEYSAQSIGEEVPKKVTVYMCVIGKYDAPQVPLILMSDYNYVLYTNNEMMAPNGWEVRRIPDKLNGMTANYINRYIKLHPWEFFDTRYTVYIDGNVRLLTSVSSYLPKTKVKTGIAMFSHPERDCLYREAAACVYLGKGNADAIKNQVSGYKNEGMPQNYGLKEATIIVCDLDNSMCKTIMNNWWDEFVRSDSNRDQISLPYVLWKNKLEIGDIGNLGSNIREDLKLQINYHTKK